MFQPTCLRSFEKISRIRSAKRECDLVMRIQYSVEDQNGCMVYYIGHVEALTD